MASVELVNVVVTALSTGAALGVKDTAATAVKDAYAALREVLGRRWGHDRMEAITAVAEEHDTETAALEAMRHALIEADVVIDDEVLAAANEVLEQVRRSEKYKVDAREAKGVQVGDHNTMTLNF